MNGGNRGRSDEPTGPGGFGLLVTDPEYGSGYDDQDQEEDGPGIHLAVAVGVFGMFVHGVPLVLVIGGWHFE